MKKYRPIKLWIILLILITVGILFGGFLMDGWKRVLMLVCTVIMFIVFILCTTYYVQFQTDRLVIRHGLSSFNRSYRSNIKTRYILFSDIKNLSINQASKYVVINLKDGNNIMFSFNGYFKVNQIVSEFRKIDYELNNKKLFACDLINL